MSSRAVLRLPRNIFPHINVFLGLLLVGQLIVSLCAEMSPRVTC